MIDILQYFARLTETTVQIIAQGSSWGLKKQVVAPAIMVATLHLPTVGLLEKSTFV